MADERLNREPTENPGEEPRNAEDAPLEADAGDAVTPEARPSGGWEELLEAARRMGFRNPDLAARYAGFEDDPQGALEKLARSEPYLLAPRVGPSNPPVSREPETLAQRLRRALKARRSRPFRS